MARSSKLAAASIALLCAAGLTLVACGGDDDAPPEPIVAKTSNGEVQAVERANLGMRSYYGIPFATPPLGNLRWTPPQPPANWTRLTKTAPSAPCLQTSASPFRLSNDTEDCLYLDVHTPNAGTGPFPVMVWIHGGAFNTGGTIVYGDPSPLVSHGVIVVPISYRMGPMGFLGHPTLEATDTSVGNYGAMDQQAALTWIKNNIAAFGGDPNNITLFGESAGGFSVLTHMAAAGSTGLFHKAIIQSGAYGVNGQLSKATLETNSTNVVNAALTAAAAASVPNLPCAAGAVTAACLRTLPDTVLRTQLAVAFNQSMASPTPSVDGKVLTQTIKATFQAGANNKVPVINGSNENEYSLFIAIGELGRRNAVTPPNTDPTNTTFSLSAAAYPATAGALATGTGVTATQLTTVDYPLGNFGANTVLQPALGASAIGTDVIFACNANNVTKRVQQQGNPIYAYEFRDQTAFSTAGRDAQGNNVISFSQGAGHSYEIQYLFNFSDRPARNAEQQALSNTMATYWTNFARSSGNPNGTGVPAWGDFSAGSMMGLDVAVGGGVAPLANAAFAGAHKCETTWSVLTF